MEEECIVLSEVMKVALPFLINMKKIGVLVDLQKNTLKVLCSLFETPIKSHKDNQGEITLTVALKMKHFTGHIAIKYYRLQTFCKRLRVDQAHSLE